MSSVKLTLPNGVQYTQPLGLYINGKFVDGADRIEVRNPSTSEVICNITGGTEDDVNKAVSAARAAFHRDAPWRQYSGSDRGVALTRLAELMEENLETIASIETADNGKAINMARNDVTTAAKVFRYYAGWADKNMGQAIDSEPDRFAYTRHEPIGVCGQIIPWNFPIVMFSWKVAPAIATGNTVVLKSAEMTPLSAIYMCQLIDKLGLPPGVINVLSGYGSTVGKAISEHMDIDKVAFTGSTATGRAIVKSAANSNLKRVTLELGGKSPNIVFPDADLADAAKWANNAIFANQGQNCCAGSRLFVHQDVYDSFMQLFLSVVKQNKLGDPYNEDTFQGAITSKPQMEKILQYIEQGKKEGATINVGGSEVRGDGYYVQPTVFSDVDKDMSIVRDEIFGPVVVVQKFKDTNDVLEQANDTSYGLASAVHTKDVRCAMHVAHHLQAGSVWVNCYNSIHYTTPFGGFKQSGWARELGSYALMNYTEVKSVAYNMGM